MKMIKISENVPQASAIGLGCMRITGLGSGKAVRELVETSMEAGINFFDHAKIRPNAPSAPASAMIFPENISWSPWTEA